MNLCCWPWRKRADFGSHSLFGVPYFLLPEHISMQLWLWHTANCAAFLKFTILRMQCKTHKKWKNTKFEGTKKQENIRQLVCCDPNRFRELLGVDTFDDDGISWSIRQSPGTLGSFELMSMHVARHHLRNPSCQWPTWARTPQSICKMNNDLSDLSHKAMQQFSP